MVVEYYSTYTAALCHSNSGTQVGNSGAKVVWMLASAHALHLPSIVSPGIWNGSGSRELTLNLDNSSLVSQVGLGWVARMKVY